MRDLDSGNAVAIAATLKRSFDQLVFHYQVAPMPRDGQLATFYMKIENLSYRSGELLSKSQHELSEAAALGQYNSLCSATFV